MKVEQQNQAKELTMGINNKIAVGSEVVKVGGCKYAARTLWTVTSISEDCMVTMRTIGSHCWHEATVHQDQLELFVERKDA